VSDWATTQEISAINQRGTRDLVGASVAASVRRFVHFSTTDVYGHPGHAAIEESFSGARFSNWYAETKLAAEREVRHGCDQHGLQSVILRPATVYGPRSTEVVREIARAMRRGNMVLVDRGRAVAGLCYVENLVDAAVLALRLDSASGEAFNVTDGLDITWKQFTDDLAHGLGFAQVRWSMPYWLAHGLGTSCETGYRALRRATRVSTPPLLSRQAVHVLGSDQDFSNRKARDLLGWEPQVGYPAGLEATLAWLQADGLRRQ
jgi:nucleoside-diphosphate-sugar epimerase